MKRTINFFSILLVLGMVFTSCNSDDNTTTPEPPPMGMDDDDTPPPDEFESAWLIGYRTLTPQGRIWYMEVNEELPTETNQANAVEIGLNAAIYTHESGTYTWNGDAATVTKWGVDRTTLELSVEGLLSFASSGLSGRNAPNIFFSGTQAFITKLSEGIVAEWNPTTMEIITIHQVDPLPDLGTTFSFYTEQTLFPTSDGKIMIPIVFGEPASCCDTAELPNPDGAMVAIFDPVTSSIEYRRDNRLFASDSDMMQDPIDGGFYLSTNFSQSYYEPYFDMTGRPTTHGLLKLNQDGSYDPDFFLDLSDVIDITFIRSTFFVYDKKFVFGYLDAADYQHPDSYDDRFNSFGVAPQIVILDLETNEVSAFSGFEGTGFEQGFFLGDVDGTSYFSAFNNSTGQGGLLVQNGTDAFTTATIHNGGNTFQAVAKLW